MTIPTVMATEINAEAIRTALITDSPGRARRREVRGLVQARPEATGLHQR